MGDIVVLLHKIFPPHMRKLSVHVLCCLDITDYSIDKEDKRKEIIAWKKNTPVILGISTTNLFDFQYHFSPALTDYQTFSPTSKELHSFLDIPSVVAFDGKFHWNKHGKLHRLDDKPAVIYHDGDKEWYVDGQHHREGNKPTYVKNQGIVLDRMLARDRIIPMKR